MNELKLLKVIIWKNLNEIDIIINIPNRKKPKRLTINISDTELLKQVENNKCKVAIITNEV